MKKLTIIILSLLMTFTICANPKTENGEKYMEQKLYITINGKKVSATLVENSSTKALVEKLAAGAITYEAHDYGYKIENNTRKTAESRAKNEVSLDQTYYGDFEKVGDLPWSLPRNDEDITTVPGDLILYLGKSFVIYYDKNQWDFTRLGKLDNMSQKEIKELVNAGKGNVKVKLSLE